MLGVLLRAPHMGPIGLLFIQKHVGPQVTSHITTVSSNSKGPTALIKKSYKKEIITIVIVLFTHVINTYITPKDILHIQDI